MSQENTSIKTYTVDSHVTDSRYENSFKFFVDNKLPDYPCGAANREVGAGSLIIGNNGGLISSCRKGMCYYFLIASTYIFIVIYFFGSFGLIIYLIIFGTRTLNH